jgi:thymidylate synthase ThyX
MINVKLINQSIVAPLPQAKQAANICYQAEIPPLEEVSEKTISFVKGRLFEVGHHTTLQHSSFTFVIDGISISDITFGLHLPSPFYNSDQRSGRYCGKMFTDPDYQAIEDYLTSHWPEETADSQKLAKIMAFIKKGFEIYQANIEQASTIAGQLLTAERPNLSADAITQKQQKIAQEQLRMFIPIIFPTALDFTINLSALVALWESAWTPGLREVTEKMKLEVLNFHPELYFMFTESRRRKTDWGCKLQANEVKLVFEPAIDSITVTTEGMIIPESELIGPLDKLHFTPELMENNITQLNVFGAQMSVATMGQDQRHRTIKRGLPTFTGAFYVPPIIQELIKDESSLLTQEVAENYFNEWLSLAEELSDSLLMSIVPYGAVVSYNKGCTINALIHEQVKRLCWCAQEEIYNLSRLLRQLIEENYPDNEQLLRVFEPPCLMTGRCIEGPSYCGRNISPLLPTKDFFPQRKV